MLNLSWHLELGNRMSIESKLEDKVGWCTKTHSRIRDGFPFVCIHTLQLIGYSLTNVVFSAKPVGTTTVYHASGDDGV